MSSELDPAKLKVVELRAELQSRGLDVKGNKPVLVKRLKEALEAELNKDDSVTDTSALEASTCQDEESEKDEKEEKEEDEPAQPDPVPEKETPPEPEKKKASLSPVKEPKKEEVEEPEEMEEDKKEDESDTAAESKEQTESETEQNMKKEDSIEENGTNGEAGDEDSEPKNRKSRWGTESKDQEGSEEPMEQQAEEANEDEAKPESDQRGEKRRHASPSPERLQQRRRSKSPSNEDEPVIDSSNVQLSWYDSDLHLQIDKETFLSAKPLHDGAFGYIWSGARLSHGVKTGKVRYEVKVLEEMKFDDILKIPARKDRKDKRVNRTDRDRSKKPEDKTDEKAEEKTDEKAEDKTEEKAEDKDKDEAKTEETSEEQAEDKDVKKEKEDDEEEEAEAAVEIEMKEPTPEDKKEEDEEKKEEEPAKEEDAEDEKKEKEIAKEESKPEEEHNIPSHLIRIGWSVANTGMQLGESQLSYGLESSGKFFTNNEFTEHDLKFGVGDVVCAYLEFTDNDIIMSFAVNGEEKMKYTIARADVTEEDFTLYPHVLTRNYSFQVNAGKLEEPLTAKIENFSDFVFICDAEDKVSGAVAPEKREDCEVIMMCGLPAAGKSHWVKDHVDKTTDKKYNIIGNSSILERMTVDGKPIEEKINKARWNVVLDKLTKCFNRLCEIAATRRRNFILDQTNVFPSAQRRKMRSFWGFKRHAIIVVNEDEEQARRLKLQESQTGKDLPESAVLEMKANMSIPRVGEWLEKVTFTSLAEVEAKAQVQKYNTQGRAAGFGNMQHRREFRYDYNNRWGHGGPRRDYRGNFRENRPYHNSRYSDRGHRQGGGGAWRSGGGWGGGGGMRNDRRDNRGPRDWRNNRGGMNDRHRGGGNRDHRNHGGSGANFNRNRNLIPATGNRNQGGGGNWGNQTANWNNQNQGNWANQGQNQNNWGGQGWNQGQGNWNQNQWKYGGGYNQGGYGQYANWNYYGQYAQNWNTQNQSGQTTSTTAGTASSNTTTDTTQQQYAQMTPQQQQAAWAQYAQQYAQSTATTNPTQK